MTRLTQEVWRSQRELRASIARLYRADPEFARSVFPMRCAMDLRQAHKFLKKHKRPITKENLLYTRALSTALHALRIIRDALGYHDVDAITTFPLCDFPLLRTVVEARLMSKVKVKEMIKKSVCAKEDLPFPVISDVKEMSMRITGNELIRHKWNNYDGYVAAISRCPSRTSDHGLPVYQLHMVYSRSYGVDRYFGKIMYLCRNDREHPAAVRIAPTRKGAVNATARSLIRSMEAIVKMA